MSIPVLTFFNNKGGVGKTSLVYHLSWMFARMGRRVIAVDLDPQMNLTAAFLDESQLEDLWNAQDIPNTIYRAIEPITDASSIQKAALIRITPELHLIAGDVALAGFEETISEVWPSSMNDHHLARPFRILTAFWSVAQEAASRFEADLIVADVGPNLGAINRSALIGTDFVVIPLGADLFSLQGLSNLGPTLRNWRKLWEKRLENWKTPSFPLPSGRMEPLGYVLQQYGIRLSRPVKTYERWVKRIPEVYHRDVLNEQSVTLPSPDPACLATLKHYRSLMPMAQAARKPIFDLTPADGAIGSHALAVRDAYSDFHSLAERILAEMAIRMQPV